MGYQLRRWLADRLPPGLSPGERLVALEVADLANEQTRRAFGSATLSTLVRRTGYADIEQIGKVLAKLAQRGLELRVPVMKDGRPVVKGDGRLLFACHGHELNFLVPAESCPALVKPARSRDLESPHERTDSGSPRAHDSFGGEARVNGSEARVSTSGSPRAQEVKPACSRDPSPQSPQENSSSLLSHERVVMEALAPAGVTEEEMREVIKEIRQATKGKIENPNSYFRTIAQRGDLPDYLNRVRANAERAASYAARQAQPPPTVPEQAPAPDEPSVTPEEREAAIAAVREALQGSRVRKSEKGPTRLLRPQQTTEEPSPAVQAARAYLNTRGDYHEWMAAARDKLGETASRDDVVVLAADLARA